MKALTKDDFGCRVNITHQMVSYYTNNNYDRAKKKWKNLERKEQNCIFLGSRHIQSGFRTYDDGYGRVFVPEHYMKVALVSVNNRLNPIYVAFECLEKTNP